MSSKGVDVEYLLRISIVYTTNHAELNSARQCVALEKIVGYETSSYFEDLPKASDGRLCVLHILLLSNLDPTLQPKAG